MKSTKFIPENVQYGDLIRLGRRCQRQGITPGVHLVIGTTGITYHLFPGPKVNEFDLKEYCTEHIKTSS